MMFYCSSGGSEPLSGSKTDIVRGIITEKLTTAAQEIFAVVERIVTDYEAEASGLRQQMDHQRRQLELLQPRVQLLREELVPDQRSHEVVAAGEEEEQPDEEEAESQDLLPVTTKEEEEEEEAGDYDEQQLPADIGPFQDNLKDPDYIIPSRSTSSMIHQVRKGPGRPRIKDKYDGLDLRVRLLEDPEMEVLSNKVLKKTLVQDLKCPRGLQESDFMDLLRSSFPQLANGEPFDLFKTDRRRKLLPLKVKALTPEEIHETDNWPRRCGQLLTLYLRLKNGEQNILNKEGELCDFPAVVDPPSAEPVHLQNNEAEIHQSVIDKRRDHVSSSLTGSQDQELLPEEEGAENDSSNDGEEKLDSGDWDPELEPPTKTKGRINKSKKAVNQTEKNNCKVCGVWYRQLAGLIKHSWSHVEQQSDVCGVCEEKFDSVEKLKEHLQNHQKLHSCSLCGKTFVSIYSLNKHRARHAVKRVFKCPICDQSFDNMSGLYHHRLSHREEKPHQCDVCQKSFILEKQLMVHRETHSRDDEYSCKICNKSFTDRRSLTQHRLIHSAERRYSCEVCGKRFKLHNTLKAHMRTHTVQDRPFLCHICSKAFPSESGLKIHIQIHNSEKPFICHVCGKKFILKGGLSVHLKTHSSEAPYQCSECGRCFKHKSHLKNHAFQHSGIKQFVCGICGKACYRQEHLKVHMRTHNGEKPYKCSICEKAFTQSHCLKTHMKIHQTTENPVPVLPESSMTSAEPASVLMSSD